MSVPELVHRVIVMHHHEVAHPLAFLRGELRQGRRLGHCTHHALWVEACAVANPGIPGQSAERHTEVQPCRNPLFGKRVSTMGMSHIQGHLRPEAFPELHDFGSAVFGQFGHPIRDPAQHQPLQLGAIPGIAKRQR